MNNNSDFERQAEWQQNIRKAVNASLRGGARTLFIVGCCFPVIVRPALASDLLPVVSDSFVHRGIVDAPVVNGATMTVTQHADPISGVAKAIVNWKSFNVAAGHTVNFAQPGSSAILMNRIHQADPSKIFGAVNAPGKIYLLNQNGILFGAGSQINVNSLVASSLNIEDEVLENGILSAIKSEKAALVPFVDENGVPVVGQKITVEAGATINAEKGGSVMIFAPEIENNGLIQTPDGQTILAAGQKVYLQASDDPALRGILVEVDSGGTVTNLGEVIAERGNITLMGLAVNQKGRLTATSSVSSNGSIRLLARDTVQLTNSAGTISMAATRGGELLLDEASVTEILAELDSDETAVDSQRQYASRVEMMGKTVHLKNDSVVEAAGGEVVIEAVADPSKIGPQGGVPKTDNDAVRVQIDPGALIDVAGNSVQLAMSRNQLELELRGNELKDLPLQRDGVLRGEKVKIDVRKADQFELGDISGALGTIQRGVGERTSEGGTISISSEGDIRLLEGATLDVSGGWIDFQEGEVESTWLISNNQLFDINEAPGDRPYSSIYGVIARREEAYVEGKNGGTIQLAAHGMIVDANLVGNVKVGKYQRTADQRPMGGKLVIGFSDGQGLFDYRAPNIELLDKNLAETIGPFSIEIGQSFNEAGLAEYSNQLLFSTAFLKSGGFSRAELNSNGSVVIRSASRLDLQGGGELSVRARSVEINRSITANGGSLSFNSAVINDVVADTSKPAGLFVGDDVILDVSGNWTNDLPQLAGSSPSSAIFLDAGSIQFDVDVTGASLELGDRVGLLALGGAMQTATGKLEAGAGGDVRIAAEGAEIALSRGADNFVLGHGFEGGGQFELVANELTINHDSVSDWLAGQTVTAGNAWQVEDFFFSESGFSSFRLVSNQRDLVVSSDSQLGLKNASLFLPVSALLSGSGSLASVLGSSLNQSLLGDKTAALSSALLQPLQALPDWQGAAGAFGFKPLYQRRAGELELAVSVLSSGPRPSLKLEAGSQINADPGSKITLSNDGGGVIQIAGSIEAAGADIQIDLGRQSSQGFDLSHALVLEETAKIDVGATFVDLPNLLGLKQAKKFDAGNVELSSSGYVVVEKGAEILADGKVAILDLESPLADSPVKFDQSVIAESGSLSLSAAEGIALEGDYSARAASYSGASGGSLTVRLDSSLRGDTGVLSGFPELQSEIGLGVGFAPVMDSAFTAGDMMPAQLTGKASISADWVGSTGISHLTLSSPAGAIALNGDFSLNLQRDIVLDAPILKGGAGVAQLNANYVALGAVRDSGAAASGGSAILEVDAAFIDLIGYSSLEGFGTVNLTSDDDIRLRGIAGQFLMEGDLTVKADQLYPASMTDFLIDAGNSGSISILPNGEAGLALSAGGEVTLHAKTIIQQGIVKAPAGEIVFQAEENLELADGSISSVSLDGETILLGQILNGSEWLHEDVIYSASQQNLGEKSVVLQGQSVQVDENAVVDLSGGGDLLAWEFVPGPGGSKDFLLAENGANLFAVLPRYSSAVAAYDSRESSGWDFSAGESVYLAGGNGLAEGEYVKLPARYAMLPGAFLIESVEGYENIAFGDSVQVADGALLVAGQKGVARTSVRDSSTAGYIIRPGSYTGELSEFKLHSSDDFIIATAEANDFNQPRLNRDAGRLVVNGTDQVKLAGEILTAAEAGARGAQVDILGETLQVVTSRQNLTGVVELLAEELNGLNAESLLIGGRRTIDSTGSSIEVSSDSLLVEGGVELTATELMLVARDALEVKNGAVLTGSGEASGAGEQLTLRGDNALLVVSANPDISLNREADGSLVADGNLNIESGAVLRADSSIIIDATGDSQSEATIEMESGSLALGASKVSLGDIASVSKGLLLDDARLAALGGLDLTLRSSSTIDFYGTVDLAGGEMALLSSGLVADQSSAAVVSIQADSLLLANPSGAAQPLAVANPNGDLVVDVKRLELGEGAVAVEGFTKLTATVDGDLVTGGDGSLWVNGDLDLTAARIGGIGGGDYQIVATGDAVVKRTFLDSSAPEIRDIAANISFQAQQLLFDGRVEMPTGRLALTATSGDLTVSANALIDLSGASIDSVETIDLPGGELVLTSQQGDINLLEGSQIDLRGGREAAESGSMSLLAKTGTISLKGEQFASASNPEQGGRLTVDGWQLDGGFSLFSAQVEKGNFTGSQKIRVRSGDLLVQEGDSVNAQNITLVADNGRIEVAGQLATVGHDGGLVQLIADGDVKISSKGAVDAHARAPGGEGGEVQLASAQGEIDLSETSDGADRGIHVYGLDDQGGETGSGTVHLRTRVSGSGDHIHLNRGSGATETVATSISGAERIDIEAVRLYTGVSNIDSAAIAQYEADATTFMAHAGSIKSDLGVDSDSRFHLLAGIELQGSGNVTLSEDWDLSVLRFNGEPGVLTIRASGDLLLNGSLKDGVKTEQILVPAPLPFLPPSIVEVETLMSDRSWGLRLVAGSDHGADPMALGELPKAFALASNEIVRTGTGNIEIASSGDMTFGNEKSVIYSLGRQAGNSLDRRNEALGKPVEKYLPVEGGDITLTAKGDIIGSGTAQTKTQLYVEWYKRQEAIDGVSSLFVSSADEDAGTWLTFDTFEQGIGALGGGNLKVVAGGDIERVSLSTPTYLARDYDSGVEGRYGDGALDVFAGGDIRGGIFFVGDGDGVIRANGDIVGGREDSLGIGMDTLFALMGGTLDVSAGGDLAVEGIYNPTTVFIKDEPIFVSYTDNSAASLLSLGGDLSVNPGETGIQRNTLFNFKNTSGPFRFMPGTVEMFAVQGDLVLNGGALMLAPDVDGNLALYAGNNISNSAVLIVSDVSIDQLPSLGNPVATTSAFNLLTSSSDHAIPPVHLGDSQRSWVVADKGDIDGGNYLISEQFTLKAGRDIRNIRLNGQNIDESDVTRIEAGRDLVQTSSTQVIRVAGPGRLEVVAGRNVDLGKSVGIETTGNLSNGILDDQGADVYLMVGVDAGIDFQGFYDHYFVSSEAEYSELLQQFLNDSFADPLDLAAFEALPITEQWQQIGEHFMPRVVDAFYSELRAAGREANQLVDGDFSRGYDAIARLFPGSDYEGDLSLFFSKIYSLDGGSLNLLVPGGLINAGLAAAPADAPDKAPGELGVVAQSHGDVRSFSSGNFQVNQSRVMTLLGGDILMWSSFGNLDAGRGSKSAISAPEPRITVTDSGEVLVDLSNTISGSGIQAIVTDPTVTPGDVDLIAPNGEVNAGDAGIAASGNINIAAVRVIGADNIQAGGIAVGVPSTNTGAVSTGGLSGVNNVASNASRLAEDSTSQGDGSGDQSASQTANLSVEVLGFGDEEGDDTGVCVETDQGNACGEDEKV